MSQKNICLCVYRGEQGQEETSNSFSFAPLTPIKVTQRNRGCKVWVGEWAFRFGSISGSTSWLIKIKLSRQLRQRVLISSCNHIWFVDSLGWGSGNWLLVLYRLMVGFKAMWTDLISFNLQYWLFIAGKNPGLFPKRFFSFLCGYFFSNFIFVYFKFFNLFCATFLSLHLCIYFHVCGI